LETRCLRVPQRNCDGGTSLRVTSGRGRSKKLRENETQLWRGGLWRRTHQESVCGGGRGQDVVLPSRKLGKRPRKGLRKTKARGGGKKECGGNQGDQKLRTSTWGRITPAKAKRGDEGAPRLQRKWGDGRKGNGTTRKPHTETRRKRSEDQRTD